ncbi:nuclease-like protein [Nocardia tenerifensis]|uniref:Nuclease-like protein n=1 Tax=Nocardia tenerifensis TaxID=228006 RepID=A0A318K0Q4_9NOCA|nr:nuclease-related domain-containing protein [Nocardia tenerifensis]PXX65134.1 nuclease-like protein [Nocardia tenerifensis]
MLVRVTPGAQLSGAEQEFVECLRSYPSAALAVIDLRVGDRRIDAVVWTPRGLTVLEVKGFRRRQSGILSISADGPWKISDADADLDEPAGSPSDRLEHGISAVRTTLERALIDPGHVCGAVVLVPFRGAVVRPSRTNLRPGLDVVVGNVADATELRIYIEGFSAGPRKWTADRVIGDCAALGLAELAPSRADLVAAGFEQVAQESPSVIARPPKPRVEPTPGVGTKRHAYAGWTVVALAVIGMFVVIGVVAASLARDSSHPTPQETSTPSPTPSPSPYHPTPCWPFQQDC